MITPSPAAVTAAWADAVIAAVRAAGVTRAVTSPGSRSAPLVLAAQRAGILASSIIDERAAAFYALGHARATQAPVALICTSGTAGAHYFPAIIEASEAGVPLVAITADRPPELSGAAAPQTIDQTRLFGAFVRGFVDLGPPRASERALRAATRRAAQAAALCLSPAPGPVHVNVPADEPLVPPAEPGAIPQTPPPPALRPARTEPDARAIEDVAARFTRGLRGVIVAGPAPIAHERKRAAFALADATGFPILVEAASQLRFAGSKSPALARDGFDLALSSPEIRRRLQLDLVIQIGRPPTSAAVAKHLTGAPDLERIVLAERGCPDPESTASTVLYGDVGASLTALARALADRARPADPEVAEILARADALTWECVEAELGGGEDGPMGEGAAVRAAVAAAPRGALLCLGNSLPIRTVDRYCPARLAEADVATQRGANGIDGAVAGAAGAAAGRGAPTLALLGDVSFAHDVGGLAAARGARSPLVFVVIDNGGGRIFDQLPVADYADGAPWYTDHFTTPPPIAADDAAAAYGLPGRRCTTVGELGAKVGAALARPECTVIRACVEAMSAAREHARLRDAVDRAAAEARL